MLVPSHDTGGCVEPQALSLVEDAWVTEVVPRLPADLAEQARAVKAFQRVRSLATPYDLLRLTFRTLFWSSEAMLTAPPKSSSTRRPPWPHSTSGARRT